MIVEFYRRGNWNRHFQKCPVVTKQQFIKQMNVTPPSELKVNSLADAPTQVLDVGIVCDGLWSRIVKGVDMTGLHGASIKYGRPRHIFYRKDELGKVTKYTGTFKSPDCLIFAVLPGTQTPNGTFTCNVCARIVEDPGFLKDVLQCDPEASHVPHKLTNHRYMNEFAKYVVHVCCFGCVRVNNVPIRSFSFLFFVFTCILTRL